MLVVYPKPGMKVRDPVKKDYLPEEGRKVNELESYWARRIADGDVVSEKPSVSNAPSTPATASSKGDDGK